MMEKKQTRRMFGRFFGILLTLALILSMMPLAAFANALEDDYVSGDGKSWRDSVYVLGRRVTSENCNDVLDDGGSVTYEHETRTLTLTNATLDLSDYYMDPEVENNTVYGIDTFRNLTIVLCGENKIVSTVASFGADKEYVYGITTSDDLQIEGTGTLDIEIATAADNGIQKYYGIDSSWQLTISNPWLQVSLTGDGFSNGIYAGFRGFSLQNNAVVKVSVQGSTGTAVYDNSFAGSTLDEGSSIEMISDNRAFQYIRLSDPDTSVLVNAEATPEGAQAWDQETRLTEYRYVCLTNNGGGRGFKDRVYFLGTVVTEDNCNDLLGDGGSVQYDFETKTMTLTNAKINLENYSMDPSVENNYVAGINAFEAINIKLVGVNMIYSDAAFYADDKEYVFGITSEDAVNIYGTGSLDINVNTGKQGIQYYGIDGGRSLTVSCPVLRVNMEGSGESTGISVNWNGLNLEDGSYVLVTADGETSTALYESSFGKLAVGENAVLELVSENRAFQYIFLSEAMTSAGALVNTEATGAGATEWDRTTRLTEYKYVRFPEAKSLDQATVTLSSTDFTYNKSVQKPDVTVEDNGIVLTEGTDYSLCWSDENSTNAGEYTVEVIGSRCRYIGSVERSYRINPAKSTIKVEDKTVTYSGNAVTAGKVTKTGSTGKVTYKYYSNKACTKTVKAANVKNAGTYYVKATVAADKNYKTATSKAAKITIKKSTQKVSSVTPSKKTIKAGKSFKLKAKASKEKGTAVFTKKSGNSKIKVSNAGKVTVGKGTKAGTYSLKVRVKIKETKNYKKTKTVTRTINVTVK